MKRLLVLLLCAACGETTPPPSMGAWRIDVRTTIEDGAYLLPDDALKPGEAGPSSMVRHGDELWIAYAHLRAFQTAGIGWLAAHDATTLERTQLIKLVHGDVECRNPVALHRVGDLLHIACAGLISFADPSNDGVVMTVSLEKRAVVAAGRVGNAPGSIAYAGNDLWLGDGETGGVWRLDAKTFASPTLLLPCTKDDTHQGYVADVFANEDRLFVACFNDDTIVELDSATGNPVGEPLSTGDAPIKIHEQAGRLYVLDNLGGTLSLIDLTSPPSSEPAAINLGRAGEQGGNDPQGLAGGDGILGATNSTWGTFVVVDLDTRRLVASLDLKPSADAASNFPTAVTYEDGVFHVLVPGLELDTNDVPGELIRIVEETR